MLEVRAEENGQTQDNSGPRGVVPQVLAGRGGVLAAGVNSATRARVLPRGRSCHHTEVMTGTQSSRQGLGSVGTL